MVNSNSQFKVILGSSSVFRQEVLKEMGYTFTIMAADIDEKSIRKEKPEELVTSLAEAKAEAIMQKLSLGDYQKDIEPSLLITCDQVVVYEGVIREKPSSEEEARCFMKGYSGGTTATVSSVLVTNLKTGFRKGDWEKVNIHFHSIPDEVIDKMIVEGTVFYAAGGVVVEHPLMQPYVREMEGTIDSVMGLPKGLTQKLIMEVI